MCTIVLAWRAFPDAAVAVAANRDESPDRPSSAPAVRGGDPAVLAPRDERAGGTWMGVNDRGLFVTLANRWRDADVEGERSRGLLVEDVLAAGSVEEASDVVREAVAAARYEGFTLLVADESAARLLVWTDGLAVFDLDPGVHVVVNVGHDGTYDVPERRREVGERQAANADHIRDTLAPAASEDAQEWLHRAGEVLADHEYGACLHHSRYGTVSSSLVAIGADGSVDWRYADGPPCRTDYRPVDGQI
ncbi:MAG: NRDE family protein [Halanaeroarchaeum sp.]